jgi:hypothetical protein
MTTKPEDKPKVIALGVALVAFVLYFVVFVIPKITGSAAKADTPTKPKTPVEGTAAASGANETNPASVELYADLEEPTPHLFDPFQAPVEIAETPIKFVAATTVPKPAPAAGAGVPSVGFMPGVPGHPAAAKAQPPSWPDIELVGVIPGEPAVAVLKVGDRTFHGYVGDKMQGGVKITRISEIGVVLHFAGKEVSLSIGQETPKELTAAAQVAELPEPAPSVRQAVASDDQTPLLPPMEGLHVAPAPTERVALAQPSAPRKSAAAPAAPAMAPSPQKARVVAGKRAMRHNRKRTYYRVRRGSSAYSRRYHVRGYRRSA